MSIESGKRSSIDGQWIRENETKEFKYGYSSDAGTKTDYQRIVEMLALEKIQHELIFERLVESKIKAFARDGITISKEQLLSDVNREVTRQRITYDLDNEEKLVMPKVDEQKSDVQLQVEYLKNNLGEIFGGESEITETSSMSTKK